MVNIDGNLKSLDKKCLAYRIEIPDLDSEKAPASVKQLVEKMKHFPYKEAEKRLADKNTRSLFIIKMTKSLK